MFAKAVTAGLFGIDGFVAEVEADIQNGIPALNMTGTLSPETREAQYRIWNALKNSGINIRPKKITVNFTPASIRKSGTHYDLPAAMAILASMELIPEKGLEVFPMMGEMGLDGTIRPVRGVLPMVLTLRDGGYRSVIVPEENIYEAAVVEGIKVYGAGNLRDVIDFLRGEMPKLRFISTVGLDEEHRETQGEIFISGDTEKSPFFRANGYEPDFSEVRGQEYLKRAAEIAVSGGHNILFSGPAGTGKTMIAKRMPGIMPELDIEESLEISKVYSICGLLPKDKPLLTARPFRSPHHGISEASFAGGGLNAMPGELSLASGGILFMDELPLFSRNVTEMLRQPLEDRKITVSRQRGSCTYPADFILVGAMNNCACGHFPDMEKCTCTRAQIKAYTGRLSKPLMERMDICAKAVPISIESLINTKPADMPEDSKTIRKRVENVRKIQKERFKNVDGLSLNGRMNVRETSKYCVLGKAEEELVKEIYRVRNLSGRTYHKLLKTARTIADMEGAMDIGCGHIIEAAELRNCADELFAKANYMKL